jgi:hypothetical protein
MAISTKATAKELERFISNPGMEILLPWMAAITASLIALAEQVDTDRASGTDAVDSLTVEE